MLSVYFGNDIVKVRKEAFSAVATLEDRGYGVVRVEAESYESGMCASILTSSSLFGGVSVYVLDTPSDNDLFYEELVSVLSAGIVPQSEYIVIEGPLLAAEKKKYEKNGAHLKEFSSVSGITFNVFSLADALLRKDKKALWVGIIEARTHGLSTEEVIGTLWWQLKTLRLCARTKSAAEAGMKDFSYNKAKRALVGFKAGELERLSHTLLAVYHDGHSGIRDIDYGLEAWALEL